MINEKFLQQAVATTLDQFKDLIGKYINTLMDSSEISEKGLSMVAKMMAEIYTEGMKAGATLLKDKLLEHADAIEKSGPVN